ncbi:MAG TPA: PTS sugar transporter subunit IIA [Polyangiaceae bacterium]|nr:PTS sugar transporter subunit IIA [Polyangiaceae bacterium]
MIAKDWCLAKFEATSAEQAIEKIALLLAAHWRVRDSFGHAAVLRERRSPTGLPFSPFPVAIPHVEPDHVLMPTLAVGTLAAPVTFREMACPRSSLDVSIVIVPAFTAAEQSSGALARLMEALQNDALRCALVSAEDAAQLVDLVSRAWKG